MIIAVVCDVLGAENNGTTVAAMNLINFLKKQGHRVKVLCADQKRKGEEDVYVVENINFGKVLNRYVEKVGVTLAKPDEKIVESVIKDCDVVHLLLPFPLSKCALKFAQKYDIPTTAGFHMQAENMTAYLKLNRLKLLNHSVYKHIYKSIYRYVDAIHYPTKFIRDVFESHIKKQTPGYVISNGVHKNVQKRDVAKPDNLKDKFVILTTGRYAREKCQDTLLKAVLYSKYKDKIQLIIAGQGVKEKYYKKLAKKLPNPPIMEFMSRQDLLDALNYTDLFVHPAEIELEGISCIESIACGKMTIVSDSKLSATRNFAIDEKCIFKCRDPKDLARNIDYWIEHPQEMKEYEQKYLTSAKVFDQEDCMQRMEKMMIEVVNGRKQANKNESANPSGNIAEFGQNTAEEHNETEEKERKTASA